MIKINEIEPFACGYLNAEIDDAEYRIACGLREMAKYIPIRLDKDSFFAAVAVPSEIPFAFTYKFGRGIFVRDDVVEKRKEEYASLEDEIEKIASAMRPIDTAKMLYDSFTDHENKLCARVPLDGKYIKTCWGGTWGGHSNPDYRMVLRLGTSGMREKIAVYRKQNAGNDVFYDSLEIALDALDIIGKRAHDLAVECGNSRLAEAYSNIPFNSPRNFFEACQMFKTVFEFDGIDSPGRFDYTMDDYCKNSTREERMACLRELWQFFKATRTWNLCLGGSDENGNYFMNELTLEVLEVAREYKYDTPNITLRVSTVTPDIVWRSAAETLATGIGMPAIYNDECVCPALEKLGIKPSDSHNYCMNGCNQIDIFGKSHMGLEDGEVCLAKCLDFVLHNGRCGLSGEMLGIETGTPEELDTYEKFFDAYKRQVEYITDCAIAMSDKAQRIYAKYAPNPLRSNTIEGCVESARDYKNGGPVYNHGQILTEGIADTADSLTAVKHFVYDTKKYTLAELIKAIDDDFVGHDELYHDFSTYDKFGNDKEEPDSICAAIIDHFYSYLQTKRTFRGGIYGGGCSTFSRAAFYGSGTGALPNGKHKGDDLLADSIGAVPGCDTNGPTALLNSVTKQPQNLAVSGNVLNMKFTKELFGQEKGQLGFIALAKTYFKKGGQQLSVSVVSTEELRDAQIHPEKHGDLIVRVGGYSDYFVKLSKGLQNNIITRTEIAP